MDIKQFLNDILQQSFKANGFDISIAKVGDSNKPELCDFQCNACFALSKQTGLKPAEVAEKILKNINTDGLLDADFCPPGFINFTLTNKGYNKIANLLLNDVRLGVSKHTKSKNVLFDYGGANIAKELHMGHLRSPIIGEGLKRLYSFLGDGVTSDTHLGDWGLQMGLTIAQLEEDGILDFWFKKQSKKPNITLDMLNEAYPKASDRKKTEPDFKKKADDFTLFIQQKKQPFFEIYNEIRKCSVDKIKHNYKQLNCFFDLWYGESNADPYIDKVVDIFKDKGFTRVSEGALIVDVANENENIKTGKFDEKGKELLKNPMPPVILKKHNDGDLYATTDLATIYKRNFTGDKSYDEIIYITDKRQVQHFKQVFRAAKMSGISSESQVLKHIWFGTICGADGKPFKTRSGDTIKLDDVLKLVKNKAEEKLIENGVNDTSKLALTIGIGALKFGDLLNDVIKDYILDIDKFASFEGKTGPYIQYTTARINSILSKAGKFDEILNIKTPEEKNIILNILKLTDSYEICYNSNSLHPLCLAVYNLAGSYSSLYNNIKILTEPSEDRRQSLLTLSKLTLNCIIQAFGILAIDLPEKM